MAALSYPAVALQYEHKDITTDVLPLLRRIRYRDALGDRSDEIEVEFEDVERQWIDGWFPGQGDKLQPQLGYVTDLIKLGEFEITEIAYSHPPSVVKLYALATGISKSVRTEQAIKYKDTTLAKVVAQIAGRMSLEHVGTIDDVSITQLSQYQQTDVAFLAQLARDYGHMFKICGQQLVFTSRASLIDAEPVATLVNEDMIRVNLRDTVKGVPTKAEATAYDGHQKKQYSVPLEIDPLRPDEPHNSSADTLRIVANRGESKAQLERRAKAALVTAQQKRVTGSITLLGNAKLVSGQVIRIADFGKFRGRYLITESLHEYQRPNGFVSELSVAMLAYEGEEEEKADEPDA